MQVIQPFRAIVDYMITHKQPVESQVESIELGDLSGCI